MQSALGSIKHRASIWLSLLLSPLIRSLNDFVKVGSIAALPPENSTATAELLLEIEKEIVGNAETSNSNSVIERHYNAATRGARRKFFVLMAVGGVAFYDLFLLANFLIIPEEVLLMAMLQLGITTPIAAILIVAVSRDLIDSNKPTLVVLIMMLSLSLVSIVLSDSENIAIYAFALPLYIISGNIVLAIKFKMAIRFTVYANIAIALVVLFHPAIDISIATFIVAVTATASCYSVVANYRINTGLRSAYVHALVERLRAQQLSMANEDLKSLATIDGLTGLKNRRALDAITAQFWSRADASVQVAVLMIDIDHFKALNDKYGHLGGDTCLRQVAAILSTAQEGQRIMAARYGGEEFAVVIDDSTLDQAYDLAERLRTAIEQHMMVLEDGEEGVCLTVSIGCASIEPSAQSTPADLLSAADAALYRAKQCGRNQTQMANLGPSAVSDKLFA